MEKQPTPLVKWLGGKCRVLKELREFYPKEFSCYYEPFLGGGSVLYDVAPQKAIVSDPNAELINAHNVVQSDVKTLIAMLENHAKLNTKEYYLTIRALDREVGFSDKFSPAQRAARFIYLNKTGFNGLHRLNKKGENNVPYGSYSNPLIVNEDNLKSLHAWINFRKIRFMASHYKIMLNSIQDSGNFIYLDPPYTPTSSTSSFVGYDKGGFSLNDQKEVRDMAQKLDENGNFVMLSNSDTSITRELYKDMDIHPISVRRSVSAASASRINVGELIIIGKTLSESLNK